MSATPPRPRGRHRPSGAKPSPPGRRLRQFGAAALIALPIIVAALLLRPRKETPSGSGRGTTTVDRAMLDSLVAADARKDRVSTLRWAERLGELYPRDHDVLLARGTAWSDYAVEQRTGRTLPRPALRTSLERSECIRRALALMDSSARAATAPAKWLESVNRLAELEETLGLPGEALVAYENVKRRLPEAFGPALRAYWLRAVLYDPVHPDTSEWHQRMRSLGRR